MSTFEGSYKSLAQGVSQQISRERLPGQVTDQVNMLSDIVTGPRRRPGTFARQAVVQDSVVPSGILAWFTDIGGQQLHVILNTTTGVITLLDRGYAIVQILPASPYLQTAASNNIQMASVNDTLFFVNTDVMPYKISSTNEAENRSKGYAFARSGIYAKNYSVTLTNGWGTISYNYNTPSGQNAGDANAVTVNAIMAQLAAQINADTATTGMFASLTGASMFITTNDGSALTVTTDSGSVYMTTSGASRVPQTSDLPATLHPGAFGYTVGVGTDRALVYYQYDAPSSAWRETGAPGSASELRNMPISLTYNGTQFELSDAPFEGRRAGDDLTNEDPPFLNGITGLGSYQGRLVILGGSQVSMSSSKNPRRMYRITVTSLLDEDTIHVGASANSSAAYRYCIPFQKDLLLFAEKYQALVPSGNAALTPRTATVVLTSNYDSDMSAGPVALGRTLMYPVPRNRAYFGLLEMMPSVYTDSQYTSVDATAHLPEYMLNRCRFSVSSSAAGMAIFGESGNFNEVVVHEYTWDGDTKAQQAWHKWVFPYPVATMYFAGDEIVVLFAANGVLLVATIDPRPSFLGTPDQRQPFLDLVWPGELVDHQLTVPAWFRQFDPAWASKVALAQRAGPQSSEAVGAHVEGDGMRSVRSYPSGSVWGGVPFRSSMVPTEPMVVDQNGVQITTNKLTILHFIFSTANSAEYRVDVNTLAGEYDGPAGALTWSSPELEPGQARVSRVGTFTVPVRGAADTSRVEVYSGGLGELNLTGIEYRCRYFGKLRRR